MARARLVLVHGMWSDASVWQAWQGRLCAAGWSCTAITLPGHAPAATVADLDRIGLAEYVAAVLAVIDAQATPVVLIGHSLGGLIVQQVAAQRALAAAVLVNSAAPAPIFPLRLAALPALLRHFLAGRSWRGGFRLARWEADYLLLNAIPAARRAALCAAMTAESGRVMWQVALGALNLARSNRVDVEALATPMLALAGVHDRIVPIGVSRRMRRYYGQRLDYREFPQHAHWMLEEPGWADRVDEVIAWLAARQVSPA